MKRYYITDRKSAGGFAALLEIIRDQMEIGVDYIQIREKDLSGRQLFELTLAVLEARNDAPNPRPKVLVNTRADIALATKADGVHLPADAPQETLAGLLISRSCHTLNEVQEARADLVTFSPIFDSPGKGKAAGLDMLREACQFGKPIFALGGVTWENAEDCMKAGAAGIAGIRLFQDPDL